MDEAIQMDLRIYKFMGLMDLATYVRMDLWIYWVINP